MWNASDASFEMCDTIVQTGLHQTLLGNLGTMSWERGKLEVDFFEHVADSHVNIIHNVVRLSSLSRPLLHQCRAFHILQRIRENDKINEVLFYVNIFEDMLQS